MFSLLRTAISLTILLTLVWCSFTVPLGERTFAQHVDRIGETPEAKELLEGTRERINPALGEAKGRLLGEYIEAPTYPPPPGRIAAPAGAAPSTATTTTTTTTTTATTAVTPAAGRGPSTATSSGLPGQRRRRPGALPATAAGETTANTDRGGDPADPADPADPVDPQPTPSR